MPRRNPRHFLCPQRQGSPRLSQIIDFHFQRLNKSADPSYRTELMKIAGTALTELRMPEAEVLFDFLKQHRIVQIRLEIDPCPSRPARRFQESSEPLSGRSFRTKDDACSKN